MKKIISMLLMMMLLISFSIQSGCECVQHPMSIKQINIQQNQEDNKDEEQTDSNIGSFKN